MTVLRRRAGPGKRHRAVAKGAETLAISRWRYMFLVGALLLLPLAVVWQIAHLQVVPDVARGFRFLQDQGQARTVRREAIPAYRGVITDRRGEPLAVSTPVVSLWANPQVLDLQADSLVPLARKLGVPVQELTRRVALYADREFMYLSRQLAPADAQAILDLEVDGIYRQTEYKRYYPAAEVTAHLVGFTNVDDVGQEGVELAYDDWLTGRPGAKQVLKDRKGQVIKDLQLLAGEKPGDNIALSIDLRLQFLAYRELKSAIGKFRAASGSVVLLDARSGEVLAMVNQPSFNPNDRALMNTAAMRNRAVTDLLEPGSILKPLTMVAALESGKFTPHSIIDTSPGYVRIAGKTFVDPVNYGEIDLAKVLAKSSQVGTTKVAMTLQPEQIRDVFARVGLGESMGTGFPGESPGTLPNKRHWRPVEQATLAFGYGLSVTPLQLANAYAVLARNGLALPVSLVKMDGTGLPPASARQVIDPEVARAVRGMMKKVTEPGGTGTRAAIPAYEVAGKSGTVHKVGASGYQKDRYMALFAGMVPADDPRLVAVVIINDPRSEEYFGGLVAAPVFSNIATGALRLLNIPPVATPAHADQLAREPGKKAATIAAQNDAVLLGDAT